MHIGTFSRIITTGRNTNRLWRKNSRNFTHSPFRQTTASDPIILSQFIELENQISLLGSSFDHKLQLLLSHPQHLDIFDINLQTHEFSKLFTMLIKYNINFNCIQIQGLGKLLKMIPIVTPNGIQLIKNCGILNPQSNDEIINVYKNIYNSKLRILTINILIQNKQYHDANEFLKIFEQIDPSSTVHIVKFKLKLQKFCKFNYNITASDIINNNLIHLYLRELSKSNKFTLKQKFEYYLLTVFKTLSLNPTYFTRSNQIQSLNSTFLSLLYHQSGINYTIFYSYLVALYPNAKPLIKQLGMQPILETPQINIREELIQQSLPYMEDLALLYSKYLNEKRPNKNHLKRLFRNYHSAVLSYQFSEVPSISHQYHPFSKFNHDTSILSTFIDYTFTNQPFAFFKPKLITNLIIKFYETLHVAYIDHSKTIIQVTHKSQIQNLLAYLLNPRKSDFDLEKAVELVKTLSKNNVYLSGTTYMKFIETLVKLDFNQQAKEFYFYFINDPMISSKLNLKDIAVYHDRFKWPYPKYTDVDISDCMEYDANYLSQNLAPEMLIASLEKNITCTE